MKQERHYKVKELSDWWNLSEQTIRDLVRNEDGVLRLSNLGPSVGKRSYTTFIVPESVALRLYQRLTQKPVKTFLPKRHPRIIVHQKKKTLQPKTATGSD
jgi:hypothetical protein